MKTQEIVNKETNEPLTNKKGEVLFKNTLEVGDKFVSLYNAPVEEFRGQAKHPRHYTKAKVKCVNTEQEHEVFLDLTPTQYQTLLKVSQDESQDDLNQHVFTTYEYKNKYGKAIGITNKTKKEPVNIE